MRRTEKVPIDVPNSLQKTMEPLMKKPRTFEELYDAKNICEVYYKIINRPRDFSELIAIEFRDRADEIIAILHEMIDGCEEARDVVEPIRATMEPGIIDRPTWPEFHEEFPGVACSKQSFERLTKPENDYYWVKRKTTFESLIKTFVNIKSR